MISVFVRTLLIYFSLVLFLKLMGKRQVGELDVSELVCTFLLSEIVATPIEDNDVPLSMALIPMMTIISIEIILSYAITKSDLIKKILGGDPSILINRGKLDASELERSRMSVEELMSELRLKGYGNIDEVYYAMLEQNGQLSVTPMRQFSPLTPDDVDKKPKQTGISHALIIDGHIKGYGLKTSGKSKKWLVDYLEKNNLAPRDIFLLCANDAGEITLITKESEHPKRR